jgi:hypothetical protein
MKTFNSHGEIIAIVENEILIDPQGNATVCGSIAHRLWNYCQGQFPRVKCCENNFYVMELIEFPQGPRWGTRAAQTERERAVNYMTSESVLIDVTNAPNTQAKANTHHVGLDFVDVDGKRVLSFQLLNEEAKAIATADFTDGKLVRFLFADKAEARAKDWLKAFCCLRFT